MWTYIYIYIYIENQGWDHINGPNYLLDAYLMENEAKNRLNLIK